MKLYKSTPDQTQALTDMSKRAFDSDVLVGAAEAGGPPFYCDKSWHDKMQRSGHLYTIEENDVIVGGCLLSLNEKNADCLEIWRIFIDPAYFRRGFGLAAMKLIEELYPVHEFRLDTPIWNRRTRSFYTKLGFVEYFRDNEFIYFMKKNNHETR